MMIINIHKWKLVAAFATLLLIVPIQAQVDKLKGQTEMSKAIYYFKQKNLEEALSWIEQSYNENPKNSKMLYYRGFFNKEGFKKKDGERLKEEHFTKSISSFMSAKALGIPPSFSNSTEKSLLYLKSAAFKRSIDLLNAVQLEDSYKWFNKSVALAEKIEAIDDKDKQKQVDYLLLLASKYDGIISEGGIIDSTNIVKIARIYEHALEISPNGGSVNYNLALLYYNNAVNIITGLDYSYPLDEILRIQDYCVNSLFLNSLPYMQKSFDLGYQKSQSAIGLQGIYFSLNDEKNFNKYKKIYESLTSETD